MERLTYRGTEQMTEDGLIAPSYSDYPIRRIIERLADYEDAEEQGLIPKFHLGDEFWTIHWNGVRKEKIVMLQQKKDGTWKYRFPTTADYEENEFGKYFFNTKEEAEKALKQREE